MKDTKDVEQEQKYVVVTRGIFVFDEADPTKRTLRELPIGTVMEYTPTYAARSLPNKVRLLEQVEAEKAAEKTRRKAEKFGEGVRKGSEPKPAPKPVGLFAEE